MIRFGHQIGTHPGDNGNYFDSVLAVAQASETAGFDAVFYSDHFQFHRPHFFIDKLQRIAVKLKRHRPPLAAFLDQWTAQLRQRQEDDPRRTLVVLECFTTLAAIAAATSRMRLGALVAGIPYRNPALLAKVNITLDVISHGRCIVGLGAGWYEEEFKAYGWTFPAARQRIERLEEAVQIIDMMMRQRRATFSGQHYQINQAISHPLPVQQPRPPILIGGSGERHTLRLVAQYADFCNIFGSPQTVKQKLEVLREYCGRVGRPFSEITPSNYIGILIAQSQAELRHKRKQFRPWIGHPIMGTPEQIIAHLQAYIDAGIQYIIVNMPDAHTLEPIHLFAQTVMPAFQSAEPKTAGR